MTEQNVSSRCRICDQPHVLPGKWWCSGDHPRPEASKPHKAPRILIEDYGSGKHIVHNTHIWVLFEDENGEEQRVEISNLTRRVSVDMKIGEPLTAKLEVFITGFKTRAQAEEILSVYLPGKSRWRSMWRRLRRRYTDVTTFNPTGVREFYD